MVLKQNYQRSCLDGLQWRRTRLIYLKIVSSEEDGVEGKGDRQESAKILRLKDNFFRHYGNSPTDNSSPRQRAPRQIVPTLSGHLMTQLVCREMAHASYMALALMMIDWARLINLGQGLSAEEHSFGSVTPLWGIETIAPDNMVRLG